MDRSMMWAILKEKIAKEKQDGPASTFPAFILRLKEVIEKSREYIKPGGNNPRFEQLKKLNLNKAK